jgi:hypothetical protein
MNKFGLLVIGIFLAACQPTTPAGPPTVTVSSLADSGAGSLRETLSSAEVGSVVSLKGLTGTLTLASELVVSKNLTLEGGSGVVLSGDGKTRVLNVAAGSSVTLKGLKLTGGKSLAATSSNLKARAAIAGQGGIIFNAGTLVIQTGTEISGGEATQGGGVYNAGALTLEGGIIKGNKAVGTATGQGRGGGIYSELETTLNITGGSIEGNSAASNGGGVRAEAKINMSGGTIKNNTASYRGGGVMVTSGATFTFSGGSIEGNTVPGGALEPAAAYGAGVFNVGAFTMSNGTIKNNVSNRAGGGVMNAEISATFTLIGGKIEGNTASNGGGVFTSVNGMFTKNGGTVTGNTPNDIFSAQ